MRYAIEFEVTGQTLEELENAASDRITQLLGPNVSIAAGLMTISPHVESNDGTFILWRALVEVERVDRQ